MNEDVMYEVLADGIPWIDADGKDIYDWFFADGLRAHLESLGYTVEVREV